MGLFDKNTGICDNISIQGYSHIKVNKECQDNSLSWSGKGFCAAIVCDGHGGEKYIRSAVGSRLACEIGKESITAFMEKFVPSGEKQNEAMLEQLERSIVSGWYSAVESDYTASPVTEDSRFEGLSDADKKALEKNPVKAYGSTFIAAVKTDKYCFVIKLGDGNTVFFYSDGSCEMPEELVDDDCQFNVTTSLCNSDAALSFRHCFKTFSKDDAVSGITLTSDGIINCYKTEESYLSFMENVYFGFGEDGAEKAKSELIPVLNKLSERGSGDDLSIAIIRDPFSKEEAERIVRKQEKEEKERLLREAEQARIAREKAEKEAEELRKKAEEAEAEKSKLQEQLQKEKLGRENAEAKSKALETDNDAHRRFYEKQLAQQKAEEERKKELLRKKDFPTVIQYDAYYVEQSVDPPESIVGNDKTGNHAPQQGKRFLGNIIDSFFNNGGKK